MNWPMVVFVLAFCSAVYFLERVIRAAISPEVKGDLDRLREEGSVNVVKLIPSHGKPGAPCDCPCGHGACAKQLEIAASTCPGCGEIIGFDKYYTEYELNCWHDGCLRAFKDGVS